MRSPKPEQYDSFAADYEDHASAAPYNALYDRPATLQLVGDVQGLVEPQPDPAMEAPHPDTFEKLSREPGFIIFRLRKRAR